LSRLSKFSCSLVSFVVFQESDESIYPDDDDVGGKEGMLVIFPVDWVFAFSKTLNEWLHSDVWGGPVEAKNSSTLLPGVGGGGDGDDYAADFIGGANEAPMNSEIHGVARIFKSKAD
jgi:hypothetical protein